MKGLFTTVTNVNFNDQPLKTGGGPAICKKAIGGEIRDFDMPRDSGTPMKISAP